MSKLREIGEALNVPRTDEIPDCENYPCAKCMTCKSIYYIWDIVIVDEDRDEYTCKYCSK